MIARFCRGGCGPDHGVLPRFGGIVTVTGCQSSYAFGLIRCCSLAPSAHRADDEAAVEPEAPLLLVVDVDHGRWPVGVVGVRATVSQAGRGLTGWSTSKTSGPGLSLLVRKSLTIVGGISTGWPSGGRDAQKRVEMWRNGVTRDWTTKE
jgi:hypothetical protein